MKRPFHPLLFGPFIVLAVLSPNLNLLPPNQAIRPVLVLAGGSLALWLVGQIFFRNWTRSAAFASFTTLLTFGFGLLPLQIPVAAYSLVALTLAILLARRAKSPEVLNVLAFSLFALSLGNISLKIIQAKTSRAELSAETSDHPGPVPDVYFIVLDGYGRSDVLKQKIGFDNRKWLAELEGLGFRVLPKARSNYCQTELSLAATLNYNFVPNLTTADPASSNRLPLQQLISSSQVQKRFKDLGYTTVAITTGFPPTEFPNSDVNLKARGRLSLLEDTLINLTPLGSQPVFRDSMFNERRRFLQGAFESLSQTRGDSVRPRFVLAHIVAPHPPFVFDADGNPTPNRGLYGFWDGSDYTKYVGGPESYAAGYKAQAEYVTKRLLTSINDILRNDTTPPIIIIQGDHGSKMGLDQNSLEKTDLSECFPIISAVLAPTSVQEQFQDDETPVNTFRILFQSLFNENLPKLPNRSFYSPFNYPFQLTEVTDIIAPNQS